MNDSETGIPIIKDGWFKIRITTNDEREMFLPSDEILDRLIRFPTSLYVDTYKLNKYRTTPQIFDKESQLLLQKRSNLIVDYLLECPLTEYEHKISQYCKEHDMDFALAIFYKKLTDYCEFILPGLNTNYQNERAIADVMNVMKDDWNPSDQSFRKEHTNINWDYWIKRRRKYFSLIKRFPEYGHADVCVRAIVSKLNKSVLLNEYNSVNREHKWFNNHKDNLFGKNGKLRKFKGTLPPELGEGTLTQCLFCYRFHLQYPSIVKKRSSLSRCCDRDECKDKNHSWENSFTADRKDNSLHEYQLKYSDIPLSGITHAELATLDVTWGDESLYLIIKQSDVPMNGF